MSSPYGYDKYFTGVLIAVARDCATIFRYHETKAHETLRENIQNSKMQINTSLYKCA